MSCRFLLAGFQLSLIGRFWVFPEARGRRGYTSLRIPEQVALRVWRARGGAA
jgi:hypothetical protein